MSLPDEVNILGVRYSITYADNPTDVDREKRQTLWGQVDCWTRTIRVYEDKRPIEDIWQTILHEIIHAIILDLHIKELAGGDKEDAIDILAKALTDVFIRNDWLKREW